MTAKELQLDLLREYGACIGGKNLRKLLGFTSGSAFRRATTAGRLDLNLFYLPGRKGRFALVTDVAEWLTRHATRESTVQQKEGAKM